MVETTTVQHTPGPWEVEGNLIHPAVQFQADGRPYFRGGMLASCAPHDDDSPFWDTALANARRIVACVNACEGIPTELLEDDDGDAPYEKSQIMRLRAENDRLREAAGLEIEPLPSPPGPAYGADFVDIRARCNELMAALEEATDWLERTGPFEDHDEGEPSDAALGRYRALLDRAKGGVP